ncbi:hypothetical protein D8S78_12085 [Natrialba swarupiae]|nr:hypothetical protein [Natrialba swarupiae]
MSIACSGQISGASTISGIISGGSRALGERAVLEAAVFEAAVPALPVPNRERPHAVIGSRVAETFVPIQIEHGPRI